ncbi:MAG: efflux RND transporter periplasmic adaptor subunit [Candidatus Korobacteraceae bacterium]
MATATERGGRGPNGKLTWAILIGLILAVVLLAAFISLRRARVAIRVGKAEIGTITASISTNGKIEPITNFEAHAPAATTVTKVGVQQGDWVKPGQLLVQLQDAGAQAQAARAEAQLRGAQADLNAVTHGGTQEELLTNRNALTKAQADRAAAQRNLAATQRLHQSGAASQAEVDAARSQLKAADANVQLLQQKLKDRYSSSEIGHVEAQQSEAKASLAAADTLLRDSNVTAPFAGMVYSLAVKKGSFVNAGDLLVQVADLHKVRVRAFVDEPEIGRLRKGQTVEVTWDALPGRVWKGEVETLPTVIVQRATRNVGEVTCIVDNSDLRLLPNTNVTVAVIIERQENVLTVPREAIHEDAESRYVFQVVNGELKRRNVQTAVSDLTRVEVTSGLSEHASVALGAINSQSLAAGMPIKVVNQ